MTHDCFGELSSNSLRKVVQQNFIKKLVLCFHEQKPFVLKTVFLTLGLGMCKGVGEDSSHGIGHVDIRVGIMNSLECVCLPLHVHLRWGVTQVGEFNYWALLTLLWDPPFRYREYSGGRHSLEAAFEKKADMWL